MVLINLLLITIISVIIIDISGFIDSLKSGIKWCLTKGKMNNSDYRLKPIDCSFCTNFWLGIIYLLVTGNITLYYIAAVLILSCFCGLIKSSILLIEDIFKTFINRIYKFID